MKKQFFRVKQFADQTFSRAGRTELLSDELAEVDRHVEFLRTSCVNTNKKLAACLLGMGVDDAAREKRLKKCPEYLLGHAMKECAAYDEQSLLKEVLTRCGGVQVTLAHEFVEFDIQVEQCVVNPLQAVLDTDVPAVLKQKRNLTRLILDMDSARGRYNTALKHNPTAAGYQAKVDAVREEMEDAESKVEQCRDALASEMFQLISRETELAQIVATYVNLQKSYHEKALHFLENMIPDLDLFINDSDMRPVFGFSLEEHLRVTGRRIALPIELCVCALLEIAMDEEGLFRVAGGASKVKRMRLGLDAGCLNLATVVECNDPHVVAGVLKSYLRELPEPLLTHILYQDWVAAARLQGSEDVRLKALKDVVERLPAANYDNLKYLVKFLAALASNQATNKMTPQNLAIVIAPNLIWGPDHDQAALGINMSTANIHSFIVDNLVTHADFFFPKDVEFYQTYHRESIDASSQQSNASSSTRLNTINGEKGHVRSSSGDTLLISCSPGSSSSGDLKRTQSNSSLIDPNSPPHSPKPVTRRKNKVAPHPPKLPSENDRPEKPPRPVTMHIAQPPSTTPEKPTPGPLRGIPVRPPEPSTPPPSQLKARCEPMENLTTIDCTEEIPTDVQKTVSLPEHPPPVKEVMQQTSPPLSSPTKITSQRDPHVVAAGPQAVPPATPSSVAPTKITSQRDPHVVAAGPQAVPPATVSSVASAVPVHELSQTPAIATKPAASPVAPAVVSVPASSPAVVATALQESARKFPVAAPRSFTSREPLQVVTPETVAEMQEKPKPAIPERPATLQRHSGSFRQNRSDDSYSTGKIDHPRPEKPPPPILDKPSLPIPQQRPLSIHEKRNSFEKPDRPPKPELLMGSAALLPTVLPGGIDDATESDVLRDSEAKVGSLQRGQVSKPPRPQPPPPPPPAVKQRIGLAPLASESTDL